MKISIVTDAELPGGFSISAETPEEVLILRMFCAEKRGIQIASHGGNIGEGRMSMLIKHKSRFSDDVLLSLLKDDAIDVLLKDLAETVDSLESTVECNEQTREIVRKWITNVPRVGR